MNDAELTRALERGEIDNEAFHHASHLRVAWVYLSESGSVDEAADKMRDTLRRFAASAQCSFHLFMTCTARRRSSRSSIIRPASTPAGRLFSFCV